jgi:hypothetical protein
MSINHAWKILAIATIGIIAYSQVPRAEESSSITPNIDRNESLPISNTNDSNPIVDPISPVISTSQPQEIATISPPKTGLSVVKYSASNAIFPNPERGFYWQKWTLGDDAVSIAELRKARATEHVTVVRGIYDLKPYRNQALPQSVLAQFDRDCQIYRQAGAKLLPIFSYASEMNQPDTSVDRIVSHIQQLKPYILKNNDIIGAWYAGFIGPWGEWHSSSFDNISKDSRSINVNSRKVLK